MSTECLQPPHIPNIHSTCPLKIGCTSINWNNLKPIQLNSLLTFLMFGNIISVTHKKKSMLIKEGICN